MFSPGFPKIVFLTFGTRLVWEETLLDSLLNFAVTPKGLLLLQQTGAINEAVSYMFSRFTKKLQVITNTLLSDSPFVAYAGRCVTCGRAR